MLLNWLILPLVIVIQSKVYSYDSIKPREKQLSKTSNCFTVTAELAIPL